MPGEEKCMSTKHTLGGLLVVGMFGTTAPAWAADADFGVSGAGNQSCGGYLADAKPADPSGPVDAATVRHLVTLGWVGGFISYAGMLALSTAQPTDYRLRAA